MSVSLSPTNNDATLRCYNRFKSFAFWVTVGFAKRTTPRTQFAFYFCVYPEKDCFLNLISLSGLDHSNLDFRGADLRWARLNNAILVNKNLRDAKLDLAWVMGASLRSTQLRNAILRGVNFDHTRIATNLEVPTWRALHFEIQIYLRIWKISQRV